VNDKLKTNIILALGILSIILMVVTVKSCTALRTQEQNLRRESSQRFDSEAKAQKISQEQAAAVEQLKKTQESLAENAKDLEAAKKTLLQEQMVNQNMKAELEKLSKLKSALEDDLRQALANNGKKTVTPVQK
jgi:hypothetical protein